jgi:hypothetical protein
LGKGLAQDIHLFIYQFKWLEHFSVTAGLQKCQTKLSFFHFVFKKKPVENDPDSEIELEIKAGQEKCASHRLIAHSFFK